MKRTALVTGANRGIGLAIASGLAQQGLTVLLACRRKVDGEAAVRASPELAGCEIIAVDLADPASVDACVASLDGRDVDVLVNNAGVLDRSGGLAIESRALAHSMQVNLLAPQRLAFGLAAGMAARGYGRIVNVSSGWGSFAEGLEGPAAYAISKAALNAMTVKLSQAAPDCVKVNACCPGWVRTRMGGDEADRSPAEGADTPIWLATLDDSGPSGRFFRDRTAIQW